MDLVTIKEIKRPRPEDAGPLGWRDGDAWLAGGTWLFSEPQTHLRRLIDLEGYGWEPLIVSDAGLEIAATCTIAQLENLVAPREWRAAPLFRQCAHCLLASFKIRNTATVGGNLCMSLPAGSMISLTAALDGTCTIYPREGGERYVEVVDFVTGDHRNVLQPGDLLRSITLPAAALRKHTALRQMALTRFGRSSVLLIATLCPDTGRFLLTITAATRRPVQIPFDAVPGAAELAERIEAGIPDSLYFDDVHGAPAYRKHVTLFFADELRRELQREKA
ncbi:MAG TPA: FAD binding domain-containing protein [Candidatus Binataceae bacterium]